MSSDVKLGILLIINLLAMTGIIHHQMKSGRSYREAVRFIWNQVLMNRERNVASGGARDGLTLLHWTWWLTICVTLAWWIFDGSFFLSGTLLFLLVIHGHWYFYGRQWETAFAGRVIPLNANWGIVLQEVREDSLLKNKSLASLDLRKKNLLVLAIERENRFLSFPKGLETLMSGDKLVIFGDLNYYHRLLDEP